MRKKSGLGNDPLSWIKSTTDDPSHTDPPVKEKGDPVFLDKPVEKEKGTLPKFKTFDVRLTVLFREDHLDFLDKMVREVNKNRTAEFREERITKNTVLRAMVDAFKETEVDLHNISDEEVLAQRLRGRIRS